MKQKLSTLISFTFILLIFTTACKKSKGGGEVEPPVIDPPGEVIKPQNDPSLAATIGFFMNDWQPKNFTAPATTNNVTPPTTTNATVTVDRSEVISKVPTTLFSNNANTWMTQIVNQPVLMNHLTKNKPGFIRFPGGSISDIFFWNGQPNTPPTDAPDKLVKADGSTADAGYWFGKNTSDWTLSVDNYYNMLQQTGNKGLITVNYGYARYGKGANPVPQAAHLAAEWVRYDNGRTQYWEIGNENFGAWEAGYRINTANNLDGQPEYLTGALYAQHFKVFADSMRKAATQIGKTIYIGAVILEAEAPNWETNTFKTWNSGVIPGIANTPDYYVIHSYYTPFNTNSTGAQILATGAANTKHMMQYVKQQLQTYGVTEKPIALDEWNIFAVGSKQMVSHVNGLHAVSAWGEMLKQKFGFAARWDLANGWENGNDHGLFSQEDETDVPRWNPRPIFYHMYFFQRFLGDKTVSVTSSVADIEAYASSFTSGQMGVTILNTGTTAKSVDVVIKNFLKGNRFYWYTLTGGTDNGEFSRKVLVNGNTNTLPAGGPDNYLTLAANAAVTTNGIKVSVPARSAVFIGVDKK